MLSQLRKELRDLRKSPKPVSKMRKEDVVRELKNRRGETVIEMKENMIGNVTGKDVDVLTKNELISLIQVAKCKKLKGLPLDSMDKTDIIVHLKESCCPVLKDLTKK